MQRFSYVKYDTEQSALQEVFKSLFEQLDQAVSDNLPHCRESNLVHTKLEEAYMWVGKAIRDIQIKKDGQVNHVPSRGE